MDTKDIIYSLTEIRIGVRTAFAIEDMIDDIVKKLEELEQFTKHEGELVHVTMTNAKYQAYYNTFDKNYKPEADESTPQT